MPFVLLASWPSPVMDRVTLDPKDLQFWDFIQRIIPQGPKTEGLFGSEVSLITALLIMA